MAGLRRRVSFLAVVWLLSHIGTLAVSFAGLCCASSSSAASESDEDICCQGLAPGQICPLHKHGAHESSTRRAPSTPQPGECVMRSGCDSTVVTLTALTLGLGLVPELSDPSDDLNVAVVPSAAVTLVERSLDPDPHPPRA